MSIKHSHYNAHCKYRPQRTDVEAQQTGEIADTPCAVRVKSRQLQLRWLQIAGQCNFAIINLLLVRGVALVWNCLEHTTDAELLC